MINIYVKFIYTDRAYKLKPYFIYEFNFINEFNFDVLNVIYSNSSICMTI